METETRKIQQLLKDPTVTYEQRLQHGPWSVLFAWRQENHFKLTNQRRTAEKEINLWVSFPDNTSTARPPRTWIESDETDPRADLSASSEILDGDSEQWTTKRPELLAPLLPYLHHIQRWPLLISLDTFSHWSKKLHINVSQTQSVSSSAKDTAHISLLLFLKWKSL